MSKYLPTGNEFVSLPTIREDDGAIEAIGFLYMAQKGMIEVRGDDVCPLMAPFISLKDANGNYPPAALSDLRWRRENYWIPVLEANASDVRLCATYFTPVGERGFGLRMSLCSDTDVSVRFGLNGRWATAMHCVNEEKELDGVKNCFASDWNHSILFDFRSGYPLFSFAPMADQPIESTFASNNGVIDYTLYQDCDLKAHEEKTLTFYWGIGFEEVAAATSAQEMLRRGWDWEYSKTTNWLQKRICKMPTEKLSEIYNTNLFFCMFYSTGLTLDTEELICATSRSPRYYVSAAYWDRDTLLWSYPAILDADAKLAKQILFYIFGRQRRNLGVHSRYIDGTMLEPGFELDELMAPVVALNGYVEKTSDRAILEERQIRDGIAEILEKLAAEKHLSVDLYASFLQPSDDMCAYPYLTYDNMLVWLVLQKLSALYPDSYGDLAKQAERVKTAIYEHCVYHDESGNPYFAWAVDLEGHHSIYDEPPGSLQLMSYYGFCEENDEIWQNTLKVIRSPKYEYSFSDQPIAEIGCAHAPYPWVLSMCNSMLCGHEQQAWRELETLEMDNGIACESVDPVEGFCRTGAAFATAAGFLCHSLRVSVEKKKV